MKYSWVPFMMLLIQACTGCGKTYEVDPRLEPYVQRFEKHATFQVDNLVAGFGDTKKEGKNVIGVCYHSITPEIVINLEYWNKEDDLGREELMFHELGHCIYDLEHDTRVLVDEWCPFSVMHPYVLPFGCYELFHDHYIEQLFYEEDESNEYFSSLQAIPGSVRNEPTGYERSRGRSHPERCIIQHGVPDRAP